MLEASFLSFDNAEVQFSTGFPAPKSPKPYENSRKVELSYIDHVEYVFNIPELLQDSSIFWPFSIGKRVQILI